MNSKKLTDFFPPVSKSLHAAHVAVAAIADKEKRMIAAAEERIASDIRRLENLQKGLAAKRKYEETRQEKNKKAHEQRGNVEGALDIIDNVVDDLVFGGGDAPPNNNPRKYSERPEGWRVIAEYAHSWGIDQTVKVFAEELKGYTPSGVYQAVRRWRQDFREKKESPANHKREPAIGKEMDKQLKEDVLARRGVGLSVDNKILE